MKENTLYGESRYSQQKSVRNRLILRLGLVILATVYKSGVFLWIRSRGNSVCGHFKKYKGTLTVRNSSYSYRSEEGDVWSFLQTG